MLVTEDREIILFPQRAHMYEDEWIAMQRLMKQCKTS
jgi:hypothetical protein